MFYSDLIISSRTQSLIFPLCVFKKSLILYLTEAVYSGLNSQVHFMARDSIKRATFS